MATRKKTSKKTGKSAGKAKGKTKAKAKAKPKATYWCGVEVDAIKKPADKVKAEIKDSKSKSKAYKTAQELSAEQALLLAFIVKSKAPVTRAELIEFKLQNGYGYKGTSRLVTKAKGSLADRDLVERVYVETDSGRTALAVQATKAGRDCAKFVK